MEFFYSILTLGAVFLLYIYGDAFFKIRRGDSVLLSAYQKRLLGNHLKNTKVWLAVYWVIGIYNLLFSSLLFGLIFLAATLMLQMSLKLWRRAPSFDEQTAG